MCFVHVESRFPKIGVDGFSWFFILRIHFLGYPPIFGTSNVFSLSNGHQVVIGLVLGAFHGHGAFVDVTGAKRVLRLLRKLPLLRGKHDGKPRRILWLRRGDIFVVPNGWGYP